jgi:predicted NodU family carbamoyl transferase
MEICKISKEDLNKSIDLFNSVKGRLRISITNRCNLNCFFCHKEGNKCSNRDMDFNLVQKLLKSYAELGGREVNITGGEPTLHKDFIRIIKEAKKYKIEDLCFSAQETVFAMLMEVTERAIAHTGKKEILLGGGVACNSRLQEMTKILAKERGIKCFILPNQFNIDNAAMIALTGNMMFDSGYSTNLKNSKIDPYERTDEVEVSWR